MNKLGKYVLISFFALFFILPIKAGATELLMFDSPSCDWCEAWEEEVGVIYDKTDEGKLAPVRRLSIHDDMPPDLNHLKGIRYTPTFVLMAENKEVGRISGYPGEEHFWFLLNKLIGKLENKTSACPSSNQEENAKC